jgi:hypothetical protein
MHKIVFFKAGSKEVLLSWNPKNREKDRAQGYFFKDILPYKTPPLEYLVVVVGAKEDGDEGEPDDAGGVHREPDVLGLVEVF